MIYQENISNGKLYKSILLNKTDLGYKILDYDRHKNIIHVITKNNYSECIKIATGIECKITKEGNDMGYMIINGYLSCLKYNIILSESKTTHYNLYKEPIINNMLDNIYKNIDYISDIIINYKNILFIYGATNCDKLQTYYSQYCNTYAIYYKFTGNKTRKTEKHKVIDDGNINEVLKTLDFKPDLIILNNSVCCDIKTIFRCPVLFFITDIYQNKLNKYYTELETKEEHDEYINNAILTQIKDSDYAFCNSVHTQAILKNVYNLKTYIFYANFVHYHGNKIDTESDWDSRKYEYGIIMSDFKRPIKNMNKSLEFIRDKENVILIGENSSIYKKYGFECIEYIDNHEIMKYYKQIKYIVQDSYFESCSNVKIEGLFSGCKIKPVIVICSTQYPYNGGAATLAYEYHKQLLDEGIDSTCCFFVSTPHKKILDNDNKLLNPLLYPCVYMTTKIEYKSSTFISNIMSNASKIIAFNYGIIPIIKKTYFGELLYQVTGSPELTLGPSSPVNNKISYSKFINDKNYDIEHLLDNNSTKRNYTSLLYADTVNITCNATLDIYNKLYPKFTNKYKINNLEYQIYSNKYKINKKYIFDDLFDSREFLLIAVASSWERIVKNVELVFNIYNKYPNSNKIIIGNPSPEYDFNNIPNTIVLPLISNSELHQYLLKSKHLILPSYYESASITLLEALNNGCNIITSKNVGLSCLLPANLLCDDVYDINEWIEKINNNPSTIILNVNNKMNDPFYLFISGDIPGYGGAATNIYEIFKYYKQKYACCSLFISNFINKNKFENEEIDLFITNTYNIYSTVSKILKIIEPYNNVIIIYKIHNTITTIIEPYFKQKNIKKIIYLCSGLSSLSTHYKKYLCVNNNHPVKIIESDLIPIEKSDITIVNSNITHKFLKKYTKKDIKIVNTSIIFKNINVNNKFKNDIIFSSSSYKRIIKNSKLAVKVFSHPSLINLKKIIIGSDFPNDIHNIKNLIYINKNIDHPDFLELLKNTKIVFIPSYYDSSPNILYEAICNSVIPLVSNNIECKLLKPCNFFDINVDIDYIVNLILNTNINKIEEYKIEEYKIEEYKIEELLKLETILRL
tara:strand:+ start:619 stop:3873 length:3255 start_codon:yes stop_codon:yes gene_type:complete